VICIVTCVRFPWLWRYHCYNNAIVQHCYGVSLDTQQCWTVLARLADNNVNKQHCCARNNKTHATMVFGILLKSSRVWRSAGCGRVCLAADSFEVGRLGSYRKL
jgi:hypothetical protein